MTQWKHVRGSVKPDIIDESSSSFVTYERRNIAEIQVPAEGVEGAYVTEYEYDEREYTKEEYAAMTSPSTKLIMQGMNEMAADMVSTIIDII